MNPIRSETSAADRHNHDWLEVVRQNVASVRFGSVQITIHDGRVTQVESIEKTRFVTPRDETPPDRK